MNTKTFLPLTAAALFALCAGSAVLSSQHAGAAAQPQASETRIVDLNTVTVRPDAGTLASLHAERIVDLPTLTVRPDADHLAFDLAQQTAGIIDMPVLTVRPSAEDVRFVAVGAMALAGQLAAR